MTAADAAPLFADAIDPLMYRYLQARPPASLHELETQYRRWSGGSGDPRVEWLNWIAIDRSTNERVAHVQATIDLDARCVTIGYNVFRRFWGRRFAREAAAAVIAAMRERGDLDRAIAEISEPNLRSRAVIESLGFIATGSLAGSGREDERVCDDIVYTLEFDESRR